MAESKKAPKVAYNYDADTGTHELGVDDDGTFVPFVNVSDARYAQLHEYSTNRAAGAEEQQEEVTS